MSKSNENEPITLSIPIGSLTTDGTVLPLMHFPKKSKIVSVKVMNGATHAASDSNYFSLTVKNGSTTVAEMDSRAAHENGVVANVTKALNLVSGQEDRAALDDLTLTYNETGTVALTNAVLLLTYYPH
jgi:hypothetical protein